VSAIYYKIKATAGEPFTEEEGRGEVLVIDRDVISGGFNRERSIRHS
jgi:hypothetical protein